MNENKIRSFTDLNAWKEGHTLVLMIYRMARQFPKEELYGLTSQMKRAVVSVTSNIAEGFSRKTSKDKKQFYAISLGSLTELQNEMLVARDIQYIDQKEFSTVAQQSVIVHKLITGLSKGAQSYEK